MTGKLRNCFIIFHNGTVKHTQTLGAFNYCATLVVSALFTHESCKLQTARNYCPLLNLSKLIFFKSPDIHDMRVDSRPNVNCRLVYYNYGEQLGSLVTRRSHTQHCPLLKCIFHFD